MKINQETTKKKCDNTENMMPKEKQEHLKLHGFSEIVQEYIGNSLYYM